MFTLIKSIAFVLIAPIVLSVCFAKNVIPSKNNRNPAVVVKQYHFNKSLLAQIGRQ